MAGGTILRHASRENLASEPDFARLVSLACHDLRTPLATVHGFARTLLRQDALGEREHRFVEMIDAATRQMVGILDDLARAARIEAGRFETSDGEADTLALAESAREAVGEERVGVAGAGGRVRVDAAAAGRSLAALAECALRHGGLQRVEIAADAGSLELAPITAGAAPIVLGDDLRDLGAAVAARTIRALGGSLELQGERLVVRLPG
jgi:signal transduction histidine kinase